MVWSTIFAPAQLVGYIALVIGILAFLQRCDTRLKVLVAVESVVYTVHFILLGNYPASGSALVSCLRNLTSLKSRAPWWIAVFITINVAIGITCAKGATGWLPVTASALATIAVFKMHGIPMRIVLFVCTLLWLVNNALSLSIGGTLLESIIAAVNLWTIIRMVSERKSSDETPQEAAASLV